MRLLAREMAMKTDRQLITVFEFGLLVNEDESSDSDFTAIPAQTFNFLESMCLSEEESESGKFLHLRSVNRQKVLQVKNYAGVIFTPYGVQIEVLPKIAKKQDKQASRDALLIMLRHLGHFRHIETKTANVDTSKMPLLEVFIQQFLTSVNILVKRGLRSGYVPVQDNLAFKKGKLLVGNQIRKNLVNKNKFFVEFDEYVQNRPVNRLIHTALQKVSNYTRSAKNQKLARELTSLFQEIPLSDNVKQDFASIKCDRGMEYYQLPLAWTRLILEELSPLSMQGSAKALSLLFPMEAVFESFVAKVLKNQINDGFELREQVQTEQLVIHGEDKYFRLKPDLVIQQGQSNFAVLDTKWKLIDPGKSNGTDKYGLSQADFYQMFAYGHKYLKPSSSSIEKRELFLIYPAHDDFTSAIPLSFDFDVEQKLRLWVVPFKMGTSPTDSLLVLPEASLGSQWYSKGTS